MTQSQTLPWINVLHWMSTAEFRLLYTMCMWHFQNHLDVVTHVCDPNILGAWGRKMESQNPTWEFSSLRTFVQPKHKKSWECEGTGFNPQYHSHTKEEDFQVSSMQGKPLHSNTLIAAFQHTEWAVKTNVNIF